MHSFDDCRSIINSRFKTFVTIMQANQLGLTKCLICASRKLVHSEIINDKQLPSCYKQHYYLDQSVRSSRNEVSKEEYRDYYVDEIQIPYFTPKMSRSLSNNNNKDRRFNDKDLKEMSSVSESVFSSRNILFKQDSSFNFCLIPHENGLQNRDWKKKQEKAYEIISQVNERILIQAAKGKDKDMDNRNKVIENIDQFGINNKKSNDLSISNFMNNYQLCDQKIYINNQSLNASYSLLSSSSKSNKIRLIKNIDYNIEVEELTKDDVIPMPKANESIFFHTKIEPKTSKARCQLGVEIILFDKKERPDLIQTITKLCDIDKTTIANITCDMIKGQFYLKYKPQKGNIWHYSLLKHITNDYSNTMIRPSISYCEDQIESIAIKAFEQMLN